MPARHLVLPRVPPLIPVIRNRHQGDPAVFNVHIKGESHSTRDFTFRSQITREVTHFYPERGLVSIEGIDRHGEEYYNRESRKEFLCRAAALALEIKHMPYGDERRDQQRLVDVMALVARAAGHQGDPYDPRHLDDMVRERPRQRLGFSGCANTPRVPAMPQAPSDRPIAPLVGPSPVPRAKSSLIIPGR